MLILKIIFCIETFYFQLPLHSESIGDKSQKINSGRLREKQGVKSDATPSWKT